MAASRAASSISGTTVFTRSCAPSRRMPVGTPSASVSMMPPGGGSVAPVMPAASRARELSQVVCPENSYSSTGWSRDTSSRSWRPGVRPGSARHSFR